MNTSGQDPRASASQPPVRDGGSATGSRPGRVVTAGAYVVAGDRFVFMFGLPAGATDRLGVARLGGHREGNETVWQCAAREILEEASVVVRQLRPPATYWVGPPHDPAALAAGPWTAAAPEQPAPLLVAWRAEAGERRLSAGVIGAGNVESGLPYFGAVKPVRVAAKAVIIEQGKLLVVKNADPEGFWYILPGGGQEPGEALHAALRRECQEELGVDVDVHELLYVRDYIGRNHEFAAHDGDVHQLDLMFACTIRDGQAPGNGTSPDVNQVGFEWLSLAELGQYRLYPKALRAVVGRVGRSCTYLGDVN